MTYRELFEKELSERGIAWCRGTPLDFCDYRNSHTRGFATHETVHFAAAIGTRATLMTGLHEIGHVVLGHTARRGRRYEREAEATAWAIDKMRELGIPVPRKQQQDYAAYVARMKRWGDNIAASR